AILLGTRQHSTVTFVKTYDGANPQYGTVAYQGTLSPDGTEIEGRWTVPGNWSGKFLMIRSAGQAEAVARKVFERASSAVDSHNVRADHCAPPSLPSPASGGG